MTTETKIKKPARKPRLSAKNRAMLALLDLWENATPEEIEDQRETHAILEKALAENRLSLRQPLAENAIGETTENES